MDFTQNYFELFNLPQQYGVDKQKVSTQYRQLQKQFHPDNFASHSANEQRLAVQFAAYINTAYDTLNSCVLRAEYLLSLAGENIDHQSTTISDGQFLMLQMQWRENLGDIAQLADLTQAEEQLLALEKTVKQERQQLETSFNQAYIANDLQLAKQIIAKLHFAEKMLNEIGSIEASLFD